MPDFFYTYDGQKFIKNHVIGTISDPDLETEVIAYRWYSKRKKRWYLESLFRGDFEMRREIGLIFDDPQTSKFAKFAA